MPDSYLNTCTPSLVTPSSANSMANTRNNTEISMASFRTDQNISTQRVVHVSSLQRHEYAEATTDVDNHADTCVVGKHALITHVFNRTVTVSGYDPAQGTIKDMQIVSAQIAYDCPKTGEVIIVNINQAVHVPTMANNLLCPMQLRLNDVKINECPKFLMDEPSDIDHAIEVTNPEGDHLVIPLTIRGVTSCFPSRKPTRDESENAQTIFDFTAFDPDWDPHDPTYAEQENSRLDINGQLQAPGDRKSAGRLFASCHQHFDTRNSRDLQAIGDRYSKTSAVLLDVSNTLHDDSFHQALVDSVNVSSTMTGSTKPPQQVSYTSTGSKKHSITAEHLASTWDIGIERARATIKVTTQRGIRTVANPSLSRRFRTNDRQLRYRRLRQDVFGDTMVSGVKSQKQNKYAQVFATPFQWSRVYPMQLKSQAHDALSLLFKQSGVPTAMIVDGSKEQTLGEFNRKCQQADCRLKQLEPHSQWGNSAESSIRELKRGSARKMLKQRSPKVLWDHCLVLESMIRSHTANGSLVLEGQVPETYMTGETADVSEFAEFEWYQWVRFRDTTVAYPNDKRVLGRYLGPSEDVGPAMATKILKQNGQVMVRTTFARLEQDEIDSPEHKKERADFDAEIETRLGDHAKPADFPDAADPVAVNETLAFDLYEDEEQEAQRAPDRDDLDDTDFDQYLQAEVTLPKGSLMQTGTVKRRKLDHVGHKVGKSNKNAILDTREYVVEFSDGTEAEYSANVIAENMYAQCDFDGNQYLLLEAIVDHKTDGHAVEKADGNVTHNGRTTKRKTTKGWHLCIQWKDGSTSWERLAEVKESNPVQAAEYAKARGIHDEPAFAWWVDYTLKKREQIISAVNSRYHKRTHKYGIRVPKDVVEAQKLDKQNGNTYWQDAIDKEMKNVRVAFDIKDGSFTTPVGYQQIRCHIVFDVKLESFKRKARLVAGGHTTETPKTLTYASVVSRESVRIALTLAALNDLEVKAGDIMNAYLTAPVAEKVFTKCGPEFGADAGKWAIITRALYGLKSAGASFRNHLADCMRQLGYKSSLADPDVWMRAETRPSDGHQYYAYVLLYVDDILSIHHDAMSQIKSIDKYFHVKPDSMGDPDMYLGAKLRKVTLPNGVEAWSASPAKYVREAVKNIQEYLREDMPGVRLPKKAASPFLRDYAPELDVTPPLSSEQASIYGSHIGILRWMVELGRVDIITEVSMLASHLAYPREGHFEALLHIYGYLKNKYNSRIVYDPSYPDIDHSQFKDCDWKEFYGDAKEAIPINAPPARGKGVDLRLYVDSDFAGNSVTRRSRTGFLVYMNMAPIAWSSKKQATIETSVFGSEFVAMKHGMEYVRGLRYKLRMMGVPVEGPAYVYGDNMSVIYNTSRPESTIKKKSNSVCYHAVREAVAMGEILTTHVPTLENPADLCTKVVPGGRKRDHLVAMILHDLGDGIGDG